jgi:hypothetical protein
MPFASFGCCLLSVVFGLIGRQVTSVVVMVAALVGVALLASVPRPFMDPGFGAGATDLRTINTAEAEFTADNRRYGNIPELIKAGLLDPLYAKSVDCYTFTIDASVNGYTATAMPLSTNGGSYGFFTLTDNVVRYQTESSATCIPCFPAGQSGAPVQ